MMRWFVVLLLGATVAAQGQSNQRTVIRTTTHLVQLSVLVRDKNGVVSNLNQNDFTLLDNNKPQKIDLFAVESNSRVSSVEAQAPTPQLPAGVFANTASRYVGTLRGATVILIDNVNTSFGDQGYARFQLKKYLDTLGPNDSVAIYALDRSFHVLRDFTGAGQISPQQMLNLKQSLDRTAFNASGPQKMEAPQRSMLAIEAIANHLAALPGRKNLIWISDAFPLTLITNGLPSRSAHASTVAGASRLSVSGSTDGVQIDYRPIVDHAARALNNANVALYPVAASGLVGPFGAPGFEVESGIHSTMGYIAAFTGGKAFYNTNDIGGAVHEVFEESEAAYTLGFYPDGDMLDGKYHRLKLEVKSRPGIELRYREGYYADTQSGPTQEQRQLNLEQALWTPFEDSAIPMGARVERRKQGRREALHVVFAVNPNELRFEQQGDLRVATFNLAFSQVNKYGTVLARSNNLVTVKLKEDVYEQSLRKGGLPMAKDIKMKGGATELHVAVTDKPTGTSGSLIVPLTNVQTAAFR